MHCASCASLVERVLRQHAGVSGADVNYGNETARVVYDDSNVRSEDLVHLIEPLGYALVVAKDRPADAETTNEARRDKLQEVRALGHKVATSIPLALVAIFFMGWNLLAEAHAVPAIPGFWRTVYAALLPFMAAYMLFVTGTPYLKGLWRFVRHGRADMDTLIGLGTGTAFAYSLGLTLFGSYLRPYLAVEDNYYDVTIVVIAFVTLGKYLEARARYKTGGALESLLGLQAKNAHVLRDGVEKEIPASEVVPGDLLVIKPGAKIPVDGVLVSGESHVDESLVTGEPVAVRKGPGDAVTGCTLNTTGAFTFRATKVGAETLLAHIIQLVGEAQASKAPVQALADKISAVFVPAVLSVAVVTLGLWLVLGASSLGFGPALALGLSCFVGVLVIACPCALGLATPAAVTVAVGKGAAAGILLKDAATLQRLRDADVLVVDKTGTITRGKPELVEIRDVATLGEEKALALLAALESKSEHPLARAIMAAAAKKNFPLPDVTAFEALQGLGVRGVIDGKEYFAGSERLAEQRGHAPDRAMIETETKRGRTPVILGSEEGILAIMLVADAPKEGAAEAVAQLGRMGMQVVMLTGDSENTARYIAERVGIQEVTAKALPADKLAHIRQLQKLGHVVAMAGDGVNDAPALAQADVGIAMGDGADAAIETAGVTLLHGDIAKLAKALRLSRLTMRTIWQNLFWAFAFNVVGIPLAAGLFYPVFGWTLSPIFAGSAMACSSVAVVSNALRLKFRPL